jgi:glycosyltransferase involved in cell wall biosynthesis
MLGPVGSLHVSDMAGAMHERGHEVVVGGPLWEGQSEPSPIDDAIPVSVRTWPTARWMRRLLRQIQPDLVHAHWMPIGGLALLYGASPLIVCGWGSDVLRATRREKAALRLIVRHADLVTGSSSVLLRALEDLGAPSTRTALINWGVDLESFSPSTEGRDAFRRRLGLPAGPMILSPRSTGALYNPDLVIRAFERVAAERSDVTLVVLGADRDRGRLGAMRFPERVRLIDRVPHGLMSDYYRAADICVSVPSSDSSPRSVWEAMACGTPCVVSDLPWVHDVLVDDQHALIVPLRDAAVAAAMLRLLGDAELAAHVSAQARGLVHEHHDRGREMDRLSALYERVVEEGGRRSQLTRALGPTVAAVGVAVARARRLAGGFG